VPVWEVRGKLLGTHLRGALHHPSECARSLIVWTDVLRGGKGVYAFGKEKVGVGNAKKVMLPSLHSQSYSYLTLEPRASALASKLQAYGIYSMRSLGHMKWYCN